MWSLGFGLEYIGVAVLRRPVVSSIVLALTLIFSFICIPKISFEGNVTVILPEHSSAYQDYEAVHDQFRDFSSDWYMVVKSDRLFTAEGMEEFRSFQLDASLVDGVNSITSFLSIPEVDPKTGEIGSYFPVTLESDEQVKTLLENLQKSHPEFSPFYSVSNNAALMVISSVDLEAPDNKLNDEDEGLGKVGKRFEKIHSEIIELKPEGFSISTSGLYAIALTISNAMISDQILLTIIGMVLGAIVGYILFQSFWAALICTAPAAMTITWSLAAFGFFGEPVNFLTTILPMLGLILAFADSIVLYFKWERMNHSGGDMIDNLYVAVKRVGPASALTSITTALAFLSFSISENQALQNFAFMGALCVVFAFLAVITTLPLAIYWAVKAKKIRRRDRISKKLAKAGTMFGYLSADSPRFVAVSAVVLAFVMLFAHFALRAEYRITDYLPKNSDVYTAEAEINNWFGGRSTVVAMVPVADTDNLVSKANRERLDVAQKIMSDALNSNSVFSIKRLWDEVDNPQALENVMSILEEEGETARQNYLSKDGKTLLVATRISTDQSIIETLDEINEMRVRFSKTEFGDEVRITGFPVLMASEYTILVQQLRESLLLAIVLGVGILGIATRSPLMALAAITPNLLPVLALETMIYFQGGVINLAQVVGLTLGFGIAIDNAVHFLNIFLTERRTGRPRYDSAMFSVREVGPALAASTLIICVAVSVTLLSSLPVAPILGTIIILVLVLALFANLAILPANILVLEKLKSRYLARKRLKHIKGASE